MTGPLIKSRLLIGSKHLGDLFYDKDRQGRGYLKLSFRNKIAGFVRGTDVPSASLAPLPLMESVRLELSYKFAEDLFSVKKIYDGRRPEYEFYKIPVPPQTCLFLLRIKDWTHLEDSDPSHSPLTLTPPSTPSVALIFSFLNEDGAPLSPPEYSDMMMGCIALPEAVLNRFCIGIAPDSNNRETNNIMIAFPMQAI